MQRLQELTIALTARLVITVQCQVSCICRSKADGEQPASNPGILSKAAAQQQGGVSTAMRFGKALPQMLLCILAVGLPTSS